MRYMSSGSCGHSIQADHTEAIVTAYGQADLLDAGPFERIPDAPYTIERDGRGTRTVPIGHKFSAEITAIVETSLGLEYTAVTDSGSLIRILPIFAVDIEPERARHYFDKGPEDAGWF
jgi:hypothetical protein